MPWGVGLLFRITLTIVLFFINVIILAAQSGLKMTRVSVVQMWIIPVSWVSMAPRGSESKVMNVDLRY